MQHNKEKLSPAIQLVSVIWKNVSRKSWQNLNDALHSALNLAISSGMKFELNDFEYMAKEFDSGWWGGYGEGFYCRAVCENNVSACLSLESWKNRKPFIFTHIRNSWPHTNLRERGRLAERCQFKWNGEDVTVTSFSDDGSSLIACSYKEKTEKNQYPEKILHQYKLTPRDLRDALSLRTKFIFQAEKASFRIFFDDEKRPRAIGKKKLGYLFSVPVIEVVHDDGKKNNSCYYLVDKTYNLKTIPLPKGAAVWK